jgi:hypothetical protein
MRCICCNASNIFSINCCNKVTLFTKPSFSTQFVLSLHCVYVILPQYRDLKYAIIHISRLAYKDCIVGCSRILYLSSISFQLFSNSNGPSGKLNNDSSSTFKHFLPAYNMSKSYLHIRITWNLQYRWCIFRNTIRIAIFITGSSSAIYNSLQLLT